MTYQFDIYIYTHKIFHKEFFLIDHLVILSLYTTKPVQCILRKTAGNILIKIMINIDIDAQFAAIKMRRFYQSIHTHMFGAFTTVHHIPYINIIMQRLVETQ